MSDVCQTCKKLEHEVNHPTGMIFVGWGTGWQTCPDCNGTGKKPSEQVPDDVVEVCNVPSCNRLVGRDHGHANDAGRLKSHEEALRDIQALGGPAALRATAALAAEVRGDEWISPEDIETDQSILRKLEEVERKLAEREHLTDKEGSSTVRQQLVKLVKDGILHEDEVVAKWLDLYTTHTYWEKRAVHPRNVSVSLYDAGDGVIQVWGVSFTVPGTLNRKDGKVDESDRVKIQKQIQKLIEKLYLD